jgi:D-alanine-D-alanine ligase
MPQPESKTVMIIHQEIPADASLDEQDVLAEADSVQEALESLGYTVKTDTLSADMATTVRRIQAQNPALVFNLVESMAGEGSLIHLPLLLLDHCNIRYTGASARSMCMTSNKILAKNLLALHAIPTPAWQSIEHFFRHDLAVNLPVILKPVSEDASVDIDDMAICSTGEQLHNRIALIPHPRRREYFIEAYVDGREINVAILADAHGPRVLPPAEIQFINYPDGKPKIVGYDAKWRAGSFEYTNTPRTFAFSSADKHLLSTVTAIAKQCWTLFGCTGYARVDFRIDDLNNPWVLEINANPCISPDSGFIAAANEAGMSREDVVRAICNDAMQGARG